MKTEGHSFLSTNASQSSWQDTADTHILIWLHLNKVLSLDFEIRQSAVLLGMTFIASDVQQVIIKKAAYARPRQTKTEGED